MLAEGAKNINSSNEQKVTVFSAFTGRKAGGGWEGVGARVGRDKKKGAENT